MKNNRAYLYISFLLLVIVLLEILVVMRIVFGDWEVTPSNIAFYIKYAALVYLISFASFFLKLRKIYIRFIFSFSISILAAFCFYIYLLMGVYV